MQKTKLEIKITIRVKKKKKKMAIIQSRQWERGGGGCVSLKYPFKDQIGRSIDRLASRLTREHRLMSC